VVTVILFFLGKGPAVPVGNYVKLATNYWFYLRLSMLVEVLIGLGHEFKGPKHVTVIADSKGRHTISNRLFIKRGDGSGPIQQRVLSMNV
jgi:hypothetical protein